MRDTIVPNIVTKDVEVPKIITKDVPINNLVPRDVPIEIPKLAPPVAAASTPDAPKTPEEKKFIEQPTYQTATYKGRIVASVDGRALSFEGGKSFWPAHPDPVTGEGVIDAQMASTATSLVITACASQIKRTKLWDCSPCTTEKKF
jgi:hypothetical protein